MSEGKRQSHTHSSGSSTRDSQHLGSLERRYSVGKITKPQSTDFADKLNSPQTKDEVKEEKTQKTVLQRISSMFLSLRVKTIATLLILILLMIAIFLAVLLSIFQTSFKSLELSTTRDATKRVSRAIFDDMDKQMQVLLSYSVWDVTYDLMANFTEEAWEEYRDDNYYYEYMVSAQKTNFAIFYYLDGTVATYVGYDLETGEELELPKELEYLPEGHPLRTNMTDPSTQTGGYLILNHNITANGSRVIGDYSPDRGTVLIVTASPIQQDATNPSISGILVYATIQGASYVQSIAVRSQLCVSMYTLSETDNPAVSPYLATASRIDATTIDIATADWENNSPFLVRPLAANNAKLIKGRECWKNANGQSPTSQPRMATYQVFEDIFHNNSILIRADVNRYINTIGNRSFGWSYGMVVLGSLLIAAAIIVFIELSVLSPILKLSYGVQEITEINDTNGRVPVTTYGEIGSLTKRVNEMLDALEKSQFKLKEEHSKLQNLLTKVSIEEQKARAIMNGIADFILTVHKQTGVIINANNSFFQKLRYPPNEVENKVNIAVIFKSTSDVMQRLEALSLDESSLETNLHSKYDNTTPVQVSVTTIKLFIDDAVVEAFVVLARNMSEHQEMKETLNQHNEKLRQLANQVEFDTMLRSPILRTVFKEYCKKEMSEDNMLFIEAVDQYRQIAKTHERALKQQEIIDTFLSSSGEYPLNLSHNVLQRELYLIEKGCGQIDIFDNLDAAVRVMVMTDTFSRFSSELKKEASKKAQPIQRDE